MGCYGMLWYAVIRNNITIIYGDTQWNRMGQRVIVWGGMAWYRMVCDTSR